MKRKVDSKLGKLCNIWRSVLEAIDKIQQTEIYEGDTDEALKRRVRKGVEDKEDANNVTMIFRMR